VQTAHASRLYVKQRDVHDDPVPDALHVEDVSPQADPAQLQDKPQVHHQATHFSLCLGPVEADTAAGSYMAAAAAGAAATGAGGRGAFLGGLTGFATRGCNGGCCGGSGDANALSAMSAAALLRACLMAERLMNSGGLRAEPSPPEPPLAAHVHEQAGQEGET
jgi:hypothetical protein